MGRTTEIQGGALFKQIKIGRGEDPCWQWLGSLNEAGYPRKKWMGMEIAARRWTYLLLYGRIPKGKVLVDTCNNRLCVNPAHCKPAIMAVAQRAGVGCNLLESDVIEWRKQLEHPDAKRKSYMAKLVERAIEETNAPKRTIHFALGNYTFHDPSLPKGIRNIIKHHEARS